VGVNVNERKVMETSAFESEGLAATTSACLDARQGLGLLGVSQFRTPGESSAGLTPFIDAFFRLGANSCTIFPRDVPNTFRLAVGYA
jgi:hypothetical protein